MMRYMNFREFRTETAVTFLQLAYLLIAFSYILAAVALYAGH